jgi:hypothetical protein
MTAGVPVGAEVKSPAAKADGKSVLVLPLSRKVTPEPLCTVTLSPYDAMGINTATIVGKITRIIMFFLSSEILLVHTNTTPRIGPKVFPDYGQQFYLRVNNFTRLHEKTSQFKAKMGPNYLERLEEA